MSTFDDFRLIKPLRNAIKDLDFVKPTPIQEESFSVILSGKDMVGIAQTIIQKVADIITKDFR